MTELTRLEQVADVLGDGGPHNPDATFETVEELVDALVDLGGEVDDRHDDHLGLKERLSTKFLQSPIDSVDDEEFIDEVEAVLEQANIIIPMVEQNSGDNLNDD